MSARAAEAARARDRLYRALRGHFHEQGFIEVETPVRVRAPALEDHIDAAPAGDAWLRTSPELHMKRLVAAGLGRIFQIGPCFRVGEYGRRHRPEFAMLEWYVAPATYRELLDGTVALLRAAATALWGTTRGAYQDTPVDFGAPWEVLPVHAAFARFAGETPEAALAAGRFEELLVTRVEPHLGVGRPTVLIDYPIALGALARACPQSPHLAERWELYVAGMELANAFGELTDAAEQRARFLRTAELRRRDGRAVYPLDEEFLAALPRMPPTAGCALGLDRLLMVLVDAPEIGDVRGEEA